MSEKPTCENAPPPEDCPRTSGMPMLDLGTWERIESELERIDELAASRRQVDPHFARGTVKKPIFSELGGRYPHRNFHFGGTALLAQCKGNEPD